MAGELPDNAKLVFGEHVDRAAEFVRLLEEHGVERGLIGPREVDKIWERHVLNSAVIEELFHQNERVVDVGSGAGLPGVPLAIVRPDLRITLLEPMARRIAWLEEVKERLSLDNVTVPLASLGRMAREPFWVRVAYRIEDRPAASPDDSPFTLQTLIDVLSRRRADKDRAQSVDAGPFRLTP